MEGHTFWHTQPVILGPEPKAVGNPYLLDTTPTSKISQTPTRLPAGLYWDIIDVDDPKKLLELFLFLKSNYSREEAFRPYYKPAALKWKLRTPGFDRYLHVMIRDQAGSIIGTICGFPSHARIQTGHVKCFVYVTLLCISFSNRNNGLAPMMISELVRRGSLREWSGPTTLSSFYVLEQKIGIPMTVIRAGWFPLDVEELVKQGALSAGDACVLPDSTVELCPLKLKDCEQIMEILNSYQNCFPVHTLFGIEQFVHSFISQESVVSSFVWKEGGEIVGFASYTWKYQPTKKGGYNRVDLTYYFAEDDKLTELMVGVLHKAKEEGHSLFCAQDTGTSSLFLENLGFRSSENLLSYLHTYNYVTSPTQSKKVSMSFF